MADLGAVIQLSQEALNDTPKDHPDRARRLHSLGVEYGNRYQRTGVMTDIETAIQRFQEALDNTLDDHPDRAYRLQSLGKGYHNRYERTGVMADLEAAIQRFQEALNDTPDDHPDRASRLQHLGDGYVHRYQKTGAKTDLETAIQRYQEVLDHLPSHIFIRLEVSIELLKLHTEAENWSLAYLAASTGVYLIPLLTPRLLENADKQNLLPTAVGLASDAAAVALIAGKTQYEAIQLLEVGRGVILGSLNEMRVDISDLQLKHPQEAEKYIQFRNQLDTPTASTRQVDRFDARTVLTRHSDQRYDAGQKMEQVIKDIRSLPGFDRFLLAPSEDELKAAAVSGPIVIVNVSKYRCDALIIKKSELRTLRLPNLHASDIRARAAALRPGLINAQLLEWLWDTIAKPVLDALRLTESLRDSWPRIWWIATGPLAKFPIHAAGYHSYGSSTVIDRANSSYSSSVRLLIQSRQIRARENAARKPEKVVLVGMQELLHAPQEIDELRGLCNAMNLQVHEPPTNRKDILAALNDCDIFHFAGHGRIDPLDPSKSALLLDDEALTVTTLFEQNLQSRKPFLAYLSACGTGQMNHDALIDEGLHLIAACQLAGFQHVVGTLWEVNDSSCVDVATITYKLMQEQNISDESVSQGLHHASRRLRDQWVSENIERGAVKRGTEVQKEDRQLVTEQSRSSQGNARIQGMLYHAMTYRCFGSHMFTLASRLYLILDGEL